MLSRQPLFWLSMDYNFSCMIASDTMFDSRGGFWGQAMQWRHSWFLGTEGRCHGNLFLAFYVWGKHWRHLANTTEPSMCGGDEALYQITLTTCYHNNSVKKPFSVCFVALHRQQVVKCRTEEQQQTRQISADHQRFFADWDTTGQDIVTGVDRYMHLAQSIHVLVDPSFLKIKNVSKSE